VIQVFFLVQVTLHFVHDDKIFMIPFLNNAIDARWRGSVVCNLGNSHFAACIYRTPLS